MGKGKKKRPLRLFYDDKKTKYYVILNGKREYLDASNMVKALKQKQTANKNVVRSRQSRGQRASRASRNPAESKQKTTMDEFLKNQYIQSFLTDFIKNQLYDKRERKTDEVKQETKTEVKEIKEREQKHPLMIEDTKDKNIRHNLLEEEIKKNKIVSEIDDLINEQKQLASDNYAILTDIINDYQITDDDQKRLNLTLDQNNPRAIIDDMAKLYEHIRMNIREITERDRKILDKLKKEVDDNANELTNINEELKDREFKLIQADDHIKKLNEERKALAEEKDKINADREFLENDLRIFRENIKARPDIRNALQHFNLASVKKKDRLSEYNTFELITEAIVNPQNDFEHSFMDAYNTDMKLPQSERHYLRDLIQAPKHKFDSEAKTLTIIKPKPPKTEVNPISEELKTISEIIKPKEQTPSLTQEELKEVENFTAEPIEQPKPLITFHNVPLIKEKPLTKKEQQNYNILSEMLENPIYFDTIDILRRITGDADDIALYLTRTAHRTNPTINHITNLIKADHNELQKGKPARFLNKYLPILNDKGEDVFNDTVKPLFKPKPRKTTNTLAIDKQPSEEITAVVPSPIYITPSTPQIKEPLAPIQEINELTGPKDAEYKTPSILHSPPITEVLTSTPQNPLTPAENMIYVTSPFPQIQEPKTTETVNYPINVLEEFEDEPSQESKEIKPPKTGMGGDVINWSIGKNKPMSDDIINDIMHYVNNTLTRSFTWLGCVDGSKEEFEQALKYITLTPDLYVMIYNTLTRAEPDGHWIALVIDTERDMTIEFFDSLGDMPDNWRVESIKKRLIDLEYPYMLKLKYNAKENQGLTNRCGLHALLFILDRIYGRNFEQASQYKQNNNDEVKTLEDAINGDDNGDYSEQSKLYNQNFYYY